MKLGIGVLRVARTPKEEEDGSKHVPCTVRILINCTRYEMPS